MMARQAPRRCHHAVRLFAPHEQGSRPLRTIAAFEQWGSATLLDPPRVAGWVQFGRNHAPSHEPLEFMQRLAALMPRPWLHLIRFGVRITSLRAASRPSLREHGVLDEA